MVTKEEAEATFQALLTKATKAAPAITTSVTEGRNYTMILIVVVLLLLIGLGAWWWIRSKNKKGSSFTLTPGVKSAKPSSQ